MTITRRFIAMLFALLLVAPAFAQAPRAYSQPELDRMLAPVALYPDPLLSQVLMAATYPAEVVEAAQWSRAHPDLQGDDAVRAAADQDWDPSVKSLLAFPQLLTRMDENLEWTQSLGDAFLGQETAVMDTVQQLRQRAYAQGNLRSDERIHVQPQGDTIIIAPAVAEVIYVPYYDPLVVYGDWWWPNYRPIYWAPWPGYARYHRFWWGSPIRLSVGFFFGGFDWRQRHVRMGHVHSHYNWSHRQAAGRWQHDGRRRDESRDRVAVRFDRRELRSAFQPPARAVESPRRRDNPQDWREQRREQMRDQIRERAQETRPERREQMREQVRENARERAQDTPRNRPEPVREQPRERPQIVQRQQAVPQPRPEAPRHVPEPRRERPEHVREQPRERPQIVQRQQAVPQPRPEAPRVQVQEPRRDAPRVQMPAPRHEPRHEARQERREERREERQQHKGRDKDRS